MSKLEVEINGDVPATAEIPMTDIPVGTVFFADMPGAADEAVFLRVFCGIINLTNPTQTWTGAAYACMGVDSYRPVSSAKLVVG